MPNYCVNSNAQPNSRDHEVHDLASTKDCLPFPSNRIDLGWHPDCQSALTDARKYYSDVNGCYYCAKGCHTT